MTQNNELAIAPEMNKVDILLEAAEFLANQLWHERPELIEREVAPDQVELVVDARGVQLARAYILKSTHQYENAIERSYRALDDRSALELRGDLCGYRATLLSRGIDLRALAHEVFDVLKKWSGARDCPEAISNFLCVAFDRETAKESANA